LRALLDPGLCQGDRFIDYCKSFDQRGIGAHERLFRPFGRSKAYFIDRVVA
jgi:hypothetical protein